MATGTDRTSREPRRVPLVRCAHAQPEVAEYSMKRQHEGVPLEECAHAQPEVGGGGVSCRPTYSPYRCIINDVIVVNLFIKIYPF